MKSRFMHHLFRLWLIGGVVSIGYRWPWTLALVAVIAAIGFGWPKLKRWHMLRTSGYSVQWSKETPSGGGYRYEEMHQGHQGPSRAFTAPLANTEPGHWEFFVPNDADWRITVPDWAQDRRREIVPRIAHHCRAADVHYPADWPG